MIKTMTIGATVLALCGQASADIYGDATGEVFDAGFTHLDITSVEITNDADWLYISIQTAGDLDAVNWGKYAIGINNGVDASDTGNGWGRNIDWNGQAITHWSATWADDGGTGVGGEVYNFDGGWQLQGATYNADSNILGDDSQHASGVQSWRLSLATLNVGIGDTIMFDIVSTGGGGGDPGVDHLSRADQATPFWDTASVAGGFSSYTLVPAPAGAAMIALGGFAAARRRR